MRKLAIIVTSAALLVGSQAQAIDFPEGASPFFFQSPTAYSSMFFDKILKAYKLKLNSGSQDLPWTYAKITGEDTSFNGAPTAYSPVQYHAILTSYGLQLTAADAKEKLTVVTYAKISGDVISFGNSPIAYGGDEWANILSAYSLAQTGVADGGGSAIQPPLTGKPGDDDGDGVVNEKDACPDTPMYAAVDERGCWALSNRVLFDFDKSVIKEEFYSVLDSTKKVFAEYPKMKVIVEGHADSTGPESYNQGLSQRRAQAVVNYLVEKVGVSAEMLKAKGYGELKPAYGNDTVEGRAKNRRVQFSPLR